MPLSRASTGAFETSASTRAGSYRSRTRDGSSKSGASTTTRSARTAHSAARHRPSTRRPHQPQKRRPPDMHISPISTARRLLGFQPGVSKPTQARVGGKVTASSAARDSVRITSISPATEQPLRVGATVKFEVQVEYSLTSSASGSVTLVIQQGESGHMPLANETTVIQKGEGTATLRKELAVPETAAIQIFTPLTGQGGSSTNVVDTRVYSVVKG